MKNRIKKSWLKMSDLVEEKKCPYCKSKKYTGIVVNDDFLEVWECFDCGKTFELKKKV